MSATEACESTHTYYYDYHDELGQVLYTVKRTEKEDGTKTCIPLRPDRRSTGYGSRRVLMHLPALARAETVILVEGEKKAEALAAVVGAGYVVTTAPGGCSGAKSVAIKHLLGPVVFPVMTPSDAKASSRRTIILWRDADEGGLQWEATFFQRFRLADPSGLSLTLRFVVPPSDVPKGWDCADAIGEGRNIETILSGALGEPAWCEVTGYGSKDIPPALLADKVIATLQPLITVDNRPWRWNDDTHVWEEMKVAALKQVVCTFMGASATTRRIDDVSNLIRVKTNTADPFITGVDPNIIPAKDSDIRLIRSETGWAYRPRMPFPDDYVRTRLGVEARFHDFGIDEPTQLLSVLNRVWRGEPDIEDRIRLLKQIFGYSLYRRCPIPTIFFFYGRSKTGKSTVIDILRWFLGPENCSEVLPKNFGGRFNLAGVEGRLANLVRELPTAQVIPDDVFKLLSDGAPQDIERKGVQNYSVALTAKHVIGTNHVPCSRDATDAMFNRISILTFPNVIPVEERDPFILDRFNEDERSRILTFALDGLVDLLDSGQFVVPESSRRALDKWREDWDTVTGFVNERCHLAPGRMVSTSAIYAEYKRYCDDVGQHPLKRNNMRDRLLAMPGVAEKRTNQWNGFEGIELESERSDVPATQPPRHLRVVNEFFAIEPDGTRDG